MYVHMGVSINGRTRRTPIVGWFIIGKSIYKWTIFWVPSFQETSIYIYIHIANQPDTLQKMTNSLLVNVDIPIDTKRLKDQSIHVRLT